MTRCSSQPTAAIVELLRTACNDETLEAVIDADPDDPAGFLVYGDWLEAHGDPRGELVAVQAAQLAARGRELARLKTREAELLETYADQLYGRALAQHSARRRSIDWYCGFIHAVDGGFEKSALDDPSTRFLRHARGLLPRVRSPLAAWTMWSTQGDIEWCGHCETLEALSIAGRHAVLPPRILDRLGMMHVDTLSAGVQLDLGERRLPRLETLGFGKVRPDVLDRVCAAVRTQSPRHLRLELSALANARPWFGRVEEIASSVTSLGLEWFERAEQLGPLEHMTFDSVRVLTTTGSGPRADGSVYPRLPALPSVQRLVLGPTASDKMENVRQIPTSPLAPSLLELDVAVKDVFAMQALFSGSFPALERLVLRAFWFSNREALWKTVFGQEAGLPAIRALEIDATGHVAHLAASPLASRLEELGLRIDDDDDAREVLDARARFPRLATLVISGERRLSAGMLEALCTSGVDVRWQRLAPAVVETPPWLQS